MFGFSSTSIASFPDNIFEINKVNKYSIKQKTKTINISAYTAGYS